MPEIGGKNVEVKRQTPVHERIKARWRGYIHVA